MCPGEGNSRPWGRIPGLDRLRSREDRDSEEWCGPSRRGVPKVSVSLIAILLLSLNTQPASPGFDDPLAYPSYNQICDSLEILSMLYPEICNLVSVGTTFGNREIMGLVISDDVMNEGVEPEILIAGGVHGDEKSSAMTALQYAEWLAEHYASDPNAQYIVNTAEVWIIPVLNPDGYFNNTMTNGRGVDPNRNFETYWSSGGSGSAPFSEVESRAIRDLTFPDWPSAVNSRNPFVAGLSLHSGDSYFMYVWSGASGAVWDIALVLDTAQEYDLLNLDPSMSVTNGWNLYPLYGEMSDWCYDIVGTIHSHVGVSMQKQPTDWQTVADNHTNALNNFCRDATYGIWGTVENSSGAPLSGIINVVRQDGGTTQVLNYSRCDMEQWGDYAKMLLPGTYNVTATVTGYTSQTVTNVVVGANQRVEVSFVLYPLSVEDEGVSGPNLSLSASPNPFSFSTGIHAVVPDGFGSLSVFDLSGRLVFFRQVGPGASCIQWNAGEGGNPLPSGIYHARLFSGGVSVTRALVLTR